MANQNTADLIIKNMSMLEESKELFWLGPDAMLDYVKANFVNPDEAFLIGYMAGKHASELVQEAQEARKNATIQARAR